MDLLSYRGTSASSSPTAKSNSAFHRRTRRSSTVRSRQCGAQPSAQHACSSPPPTSHLPCTLSPCSARAGSRIASRSRHVETSLRCTCSPKPSAISRTCTRSAAYVWLRYRVLCAAAISTSWIVALPAFIWDHRKRGSAIWPTFSRCAACSPSPSSGCGRTSFPGFGVTSIVGSLTTL